MAEDHFVSKCNENWVGTFLSLSGILPGGATERLHGVTIVKTGIKSPDFNNVFSLGRPDSLEGVSDKIDSLLVRSKVPWQLVTTAESSEFVRPLIAERKLVQTEVAPGMFLGSIPDSCPPIPAGLEIREVMSLKEMRMFLRTSSASFGEAASGLDAFKTVLKFARAGVPSFHGALYLGFVGGKPVATSLRSTTGDVAGIYYVSTLPEYRGRGFAKAMVWRAAIDGREEGCTMSCLQAANEVACHVYESMGYRTIVDYQIWRATV